MTGGQGPENARPRLVSHTEGLVASGIGKSFNKKRVVRNVSMQLRRGEAVGLLGPNGAGKTTTFHILVGLLPADEGNVQLDGTDITGLPVFQRARLGLGYLPQESSIFRGLTVEQNIRAVLE
ncbi:MAG: ATP-binding cassette domain-containing protein, partial [Alphaproteobacteria bacterium]